MTRNNRVSAHGRRALGIGMAAALALSAHTAYAQPEEEPSEEAAPEETVAPDPAPDDEAETPSPDDKAETPSPEDEAETPSPDDAELNPEPDPAAKKKKRRAPVEKAKADEEESDNAKAPTSWYRSPAYARAGSLDGAPPEPRRTAYHESMTVPDGYHLESTPRYGLVAAGVATTATLWAISTITAIALDKEATKDGDPNFDDMYWPMFIPVVGPFAAIATADSSGTGAAILALDGAIQAAGLAMVIAGFAAPTVEIVEDYKLNITPTASKNNGGVSLSGNF